MIKNVIINKIIKNIKKINSVNAIYLYGSYANGRATSFSDIDICIITDKKINRNVKADIISNSNEKIDISLFWDLPVIIRYKVLKEGKEIFRRNDDYLNDIKLKTIREYIDFRPVIKRLGEAVGVNYE